MAAKLLKGSDAIHKAIKSIQTRGANLDQSIQLAGLSILQHIEECGDTTLADKLFDAMPKGSRRVMLAEWFMAFGLIRALSAKDKDDAKRLQAGAHFGIDRTRKTDLAAAEAKPWFEMKKQEAAAEALDVYKSVRAVLARLSAAAKDGREIVNKEKALAEVESLRILLLGTEMCEDMGAKIEEVQQ